MKITSQIETQFVEKETTTTIQTILSSNNLVFTTIQPSISQTVEFLNETILFNDSNRVTNNSNLDKNENQIPTIAIVNKTQIVKNETFIPVSNDQPISHNINFINISIDSSNKIKFQITNLTTLDTNGTDSKSYALRIHLQGYKWNEKFNDVNSSESINFLQEEIKPLLIENWGVRVGVRVRG